MRIGIFVPPALFLLVACQWSGAGKLRVASFAQADQGNTNLLSASSPAPGLTSTTSATFTDADFARHVERLKGEIKKKVTNSDRRAVAAEFSFVIQRPFVVIGDETKQAVQLRAEGTVKWAVDRLKQDFFPNDPREILDIWLFKDAASYEKHARLLFGETPTTPYGYYSSAHKALIMNIETGGGTLVHEIVHPFMEANFPACPPWLNEGMGSLYEQCGDANGHIRGFTNWRLPGLQQAIRSKEVPSFKDLTAMDANAFYNEDKGVNYAQARYLCYYLQEKGVLVKFYQEFHAHQKEDPGGYQTLQRILAEADMDAFKTKWEKYVLGLRPGYEVTVVDR
ncbi:MAG: hypothetical protein ACREA9_14215 [Pyrinomonadaceae bacterium]